MTVSRSVARAVMFTSAFYAQAALAQEVVDPPPVPSEPLVPSSPGQPIPAPSDPPAPPPASAPGSEAQAPFSGDYTWMNGQSRQKAQLFKAFDGAITLSTYLDVNYAYSFSHPRDNTLTGSAAVGRHNEIQINLASVGLDLNYKNMIGRLSVQYGNMLNIIQDLDGSVNRGRSLTAQNLRYIREATAGYHFNALHGINVEAGIFMSYIGLESYLLAENWNYNRSMICDQTPFYFQGARAQIYVSPTVKIEPWIMNGWQTYGKWNNVPSFGAQVRWSPKESITVFGNFYGGTDTKGQEDRVRLHHDNSVLVRYFNEPTSSFISKAAFSFNNHIGAETGGRDATGAKLPGPADSHLVGSSLVHRVWFSKDHFALSLRGEVTSNPTSYAAQFPPPGFATGPGTKALQAWGATATFDILPTDSFTLRLEGVYRKANVPYFAGSGGTTSPDGFLPIPAGYQPDGAKDQALVLIAANFRL